MAQRLLAGLRVVDLGAEPSARAARVLGDLGASVVRVVPPGGTTRTTDAPRSPSTRAARADGSAPRSTTRRPASSRCAIGTPSE